MAQEYPLKDHHPNDPTPAFVRRMATWAKATNEITGLIRGMLADGVVTKAESDFLKTWIESNPELLNDPLVRVLATRIVRIYQDGVVTEEELVELKEVLSDYAGEEKKPTALPLDDPMPEIAIKGNTFCFTGTFVAGTRTWCHEQVTLRGGLPSERVTGELRFLVIGSKVSSGWVNQSYGRKIQAAAELRSSRNTPSIITEEHWLRFITQTEADQ